MPSSATQTLIHGKPDREQEQLLQLFWNRAQLKKEFEKLRRERDRLMDRIRQQEGATLRVQQQLEQLEGLLVDPRQAANAAVFYQLRGIWQHCRKKMTRFARDLNARQQDREHRRDIARFQQERQAEYDVIDKQLELLLKISARQEAELRACGEQLRKVNGFWHYFKRRTIKARFAHLHDSFESTVSQVANLRAAKRELARQPSPCFEGLSTEGKRLINVAIIALAQELLLHFSRHDVARLAREASVRNVTDVAYGGIQQCRELNGMIDRILKSLDTVADLADKVHHRAGLLRRSAKYRRESDTVPEAGSFGKIPRKPGTSGHDIEVNVLTEEYWDIYTILLT